MEVLREVPSDVEVAVPEELGRERRLKAVGRAQFFKVTLLQFVVTAVHISIERYVLRQPVELPFLEYVVALSLTLYLLDASSFSGNILSSLKSALENEETTTENSENEVTVEETTAAEKNDTDTSSADSENDENETAASKFTYYNADIYVGFDSVWTVSESIAINKLVNCNQVCDSEGKAVKILDSDGKVLEEGESDITLTVNEYEGKTEEQKFGGAIVGEDYITYKVARPDSLDYEPVTQAPSTTAAKIPEDIQEKLFKNKNYVLIAGGALITLIIVCVIVITGRKKRDRF